jgi:hypothetical protein
LGEGLRKAFLRGILIGDLAGAAGAAAAICLWVQDDTTGHVHDLANTGLDIFAALVLFFLIVAAVNILFNRPKFLVPPVYRDEPGAIRFWIEAWKRGGDPSGPPLPRSRRRHTDALGTTGAILIGLAFVLLITYAGYFGSFGRGETPWLGWAIALLVIGVPAFVIAYRRTKHRREDGGNRQGRQ